jgi:anthranilate 1,2-dioxygenase large subunit
MSRTNGALAQEQNHRVQWPAAYAAVPKEIFHRLDVYQEELQRIFYGPEWHPVGHLAEIPNRGDFKTFRVGEAPVLMTHGDDDRVRVFVNSCSHRGTQVETRSRGNAVKLICPYHRWVFDIEGNLVSCPGMERFPKEFQKENFHLQELRTADFRGLTFVTFSSDAPPLEQYLGEVGPMLAEILRDGRLGLLGYQKTRFAANWKEYNDNEGYHAPLLHQAFRLMKWQGGEGYGVATTSGHFGIEAALRENMRTDFLNDSSLVEFRDKSVPPRSITLGLFPVTVIVKHVDVVNLRFAFPVSPDETEVHYAYFHYADDDPEMLRHRLRQSSNFLGPSGFVSLEDGAVFNRLHVGSGAPGAVCFQAGVQSYMQQPGRVFAQNDEAGNLTKWERYRQIMGFERATA